MKQDQFKEDQGLHVLIASDDQHERVFAEIFRGEKFLALVSQQGVEGDFRIEFPGVGLDEALVERSVDLREFSEALSMAVSKLRGLPPVGGDQGTIERL